jgi:hypothetical protein
LLERIEADEEKRQAITDAQLEESWRANWGQFNRPRAVRTAQLFVPVDSLQDDRPAFAKIERVFAAVKDVHNLEAFVRLGTAAGGDDVQPSTLAPVSEDGRVVPVLPQDRQYEQLDPVLARAATALKAPGDLSEIVGTEAGFHILFAREVLEPQKRPLSEVREELKTSLLVARVEERVASFKREHPVAISYERADISELLRQVLKQK